MRVKLYRCFKFLRDGFSLFLSFPIAVATFLVTSYNLLINNIPFLRVLAPTLNRFFVLGLAVFIPLGIFLGWFYKRKSKIFAEEMVLSTESNLQVVHIQRVMMDAQTQFYLAQGMKLPFEWYQLLGYWRRLDEKEGWRP